MIGKVENRQRMNALKVNEVLLPQRTYKNKR